MKTYDLGEYIHLNQNAFIMTFEMHLRQPTFTYSACGPFNKSKERMKKLETEDSKHIYPNKLDKACFNMLWFMEILKIYLEEQLLIK